MNIPTSLLVIELILGLIFIPTFIEYCVDDYTENNKKHNPVVYIMWFIIMILSMLLSGVLIFLGYTMSIWIIDEIKELNQYIPSILFWGFIISFIVAVTYAKMEAEK